MGEIWNYKKENLNVNYSKIVDPVNKSLIQYWISAAMHPKNRRRNNGFKFKKTRLRIIASNTKCGRMDRNSMLSIKIHQLKKIMSLNIHATKLLLKRPKKVIKLI